MQPDDLDRKPNQGTWDVSALIDALLIVAVLVAVKQVVLSFSLLYAGPASTLAGMAVATYLLARRQQRWSDLGLTWPASWARVAGWTIVTFVVIVLSAQAASWIGGYVPGDIPDSGRFDHIHGNFVAYIGMMVIVWTHGSVFEELLFRAFIISKLGRFFGSGLRADLIAVLIAAAFFGYRHYYYQGINGAIQTGVIAVSMGLLYLWFGRRNILPLIIGHGAINSLAMTNIYLGSS